MSSLRASSPIWASEASLASARKRAAKPRGALARLAQIGSLRNDDGDGYENVI